MFVGVTPEQTTQIMDHYSQKMQFAREKDLGSIYHTIYEEKCNQAWVFPDQFTRRCEDVSKIEQANDAIEPAQIVQYIDADDEKWYESEEEEEEEGEQHQKD